MLAVFRNCEAAGITGVWCASTELEMNNGGETSLFSRYRYLTGNRFTMFFPALGVSYSMLVLCVTGFDPIQLFVDVDIVDSK